MQVVSDHCRKVGYVGVYVAATGGAIFHRECPVKERGELLADLSDAMEYRDDLERQLEDAKSIIVEMAKTPTGEE